MATTTAPIGSFPSPYEIETPPGCEGWQEMYPYYALFDERRRAEDEKRFWFWNSMHFPEPMPAFDVVCIDGPYQALGNWQNRVFAVPPAMGIDYRCVNGYIYISGNPVSDPEKIAERAEFFQKRAGYYYEHWPELYDRWRARMEALIAELSALRVPELPEYEPDEVAFEEDRNTSFYEVLDAYGRLLRLGDLMWQHHFEFLLLGYGAYATFAELCKANLPEIPDQHIAQMVAGIDVILFRPDAELKRLARLALELGVDGCFQQGRTPAEIDAELELSEAGRRWLAELEAIKEPWFNMATGDGLYHYYRSWQDDPSIPYASLIGYVQALKAGERIERPTEEILRERERLAEEYGALLDEETRKSFFELLRLSQTVFPYVEEHKFPCDYWFLTRWWNKVREFGALLARHGFLEEGEDVFQLSRYEVAQALDELTLSWATGGQPLGPKHWPAIAARRKALLARLGEWTPPPALGAVPDAVTDPALVMLWGVTTERVREWARHETGGGVLTGAPASPGVVEGLARVVRSVEQIGEVREGEILVCGATSPAWAPIFSKIRAAVTDVGGVMSHAAIVCREYGLPAVVGTGRATAEIQTGQRIRVDGTAGRVELLDGTSRRS
jgi:pyruvate,water dikinase